MSSTPRVPCRELSCVVFRESIQTFLLCDVGDGSQLQNSCVLCIRELLFLENGSQLQNSCVLCIREWLF